MSGITLLDNVGTLRAYPKPLKVRGQTGYSDRLLLASDGLDTLRAADEVVQQGTEQGNKDD